MLFISFLFIVAAILIPFLQKKDEFKARYLGKDVYRPSEVVKALVKRAVWNGEKSFSVLCVTEDNLPVEIPVKNFANLDGMLQKKDSNVFIYLLKGENQRDIFYKFLPFSSPVKGSAIPIDVAPKGPNVDKNELSKIAKNLRYIHIGRFVLAGVAVLFTEWSPSTAIILAGVSIAASILNTPFQNYIKSKNVCIINKEKLKKDSKNSKDDELITGDNKPPQYSSWSENEKRLYDAEQRLLSDDIEEKEEIKEVAVNEKTSQRIEPLSSDLSDDIDDSDDNENIEDDDVFEYDAEEDDDDDEYDEEAEFDNSVFDDEDYEEEEDFGDPEDFEVNTEEEIPPKITEKEAKAVKEDKTPQNEIVCKKCGCLLPKNHEGGFCPHCGSPLRIKKNNNNYQHKNKHDKPFASNQKTNNETEKSKVVPEEKKPNSQNTENTNSRERRHNKKKSSDDDALGKWVDL